MSALRLINETSGTSVSSISVTDVFTSDFDIYKIVINNVDITGATSAFIRLINSSGSEISASNYDRAFLGMFSNQAFAESRATNTTSFSSVGFYNASTGGGAVYYFFNPFSSSSYSFLLGQSSYYEGTYEANLKYIGVLKQTASMTGFSVNVSGQTFDTISVRTYGLRVDNG
jgi:hypothetical protein